MHRFAANMPRVGGLLRYSRDDSQFADLSWPPNRDNFGGRQPVVCSAGSPGVGL